MSGERLIMIVRSESWGHILHFERRFSHLCTNAGIITNQPDMIWNYVKKIQLSDAVLWLTHAPSTIQGAVLWLTQQTLNGEEHPHPTLILHLFTYMEFFSSAYLYQKLELLIKCQVCDCEEGWCRCAIALAVIDEKFRPTLGDLACIGYRWVFGADVTWGKVTLRIQLRLWW